MEESDGSVYELSEVYDDYSVSFDETSENASLVAIDGEESPPGGGNDDITKTLPQGDDFSSSPPGGEDEK